MDLIQRRLDGYPNRELRYLKWHTTSIPIQQVDPIIIILTVNCCFPPPRYPSDLFPTINMVDVGCQPFSHSLRLTQLTEDEATRPLVKAIEHMFNTLTSRIQQSTMLVCLFPTVGQNEEYRVVDCRLYLSDSPPPINGRLLVGPPFPSVESKISLNFQFLRLNSHTRNIRVDTMYDLLSPMSSKLVQSL